MSAVLVITFIFGGLVGEIQSKQFVSNMTACRMAQIELMKNKPLIYHNGEEFKYEDLTVDCLPNK